MSVAAEGQRAVSFSPCCIQPLHGFHPRATSREIRATIVRSSTEGGRNSGLKAEISAEGMALKKSLPVTLYKVSNWLIYILVACANTLFLNSCQVLRLDNCYPEKHLLFIRPHFSPEHGDR